MDKLKLGQVELNGTVLSTVARVEGMSVPALELRVEGPLDTAALTGESVPRQIGVDDACISGCINLTGVLKLRTTKAFAVPTSVDFVKQIAVCYCFHIILQTVYGKLITYSSILPYFKKNTNGFCIFFIIIQEGT